MQQRYATLGLEELTAVEQAMIMAATERSRALVANSEQPGPGAGEPSEPGVRSASREAFVREAIADLEASIDGDPYEWTYLFKICDLYLEAGEYGKAASAGERALELRPNEPRSYYALATTYRLLAGARYTTATDLGELSDAQPGARRTRFDPRASQRALVSLGLDVEQAADRATQLFTQLLDFNLKPDERRFVREVCLKPLARETGASDGGDSARAGRARLAVALLALVVLPLAWLGARLADRQPLEPTVAAAPLPSATAGPPATTPQSPIAGPALVARPTAEPTGGGCGFHPRFQTLAAVLGSQVIGACLDGGQPSGGGDLRQRTANGLLAWREMDSLSTFTDGSTTWYLCRTGLQKRAIGEPVPCGEGSGGTLLLDAFDNPDRPSLPRSASHPSHYISGYVEGEYRIATLQPDWDFAPVEYLAERYTDTSLAVDARLVGPVDGRYVALHCRAQEQPESGYRLTVLPGEQLLLLTRWDAGQPVHLVKEQHSTAILPGSQTNRLELTCSGSTIAASINGELVVVVQDGTYREGLLGISGSSLASAPSTVDARFDNLAVTKR